MENQTEKQLMTWQQLKDFCNSLPEQHLQSSVTLLHFDETHHLEEVGFFDEDLYINKEDSEDGGPLKDLQDLHDFDINDYRFQPAGWPFVATYWPYVEIPEKLH